MSNKVTDDIEVIGRSRSRMPDSLRRDLTAPKRVPNDPVAARILKLSALHPGIVEFRLADLNEMNEVTRNKLLKDIEEALGISSDGD